jgi:hypothetical protein
MADDVVEVRGKDVLICIICHECENHIAIYLSDYVRVMIELDKITSDQLDEPIGFVCVECLDNGKKDEGKDEPIQNTH